MISFDTKKLEAVVDNERWYMKALYFVLDNWIALLLGLIVFILVHTLFNRIAVPYLYECFKKMLGYESQLEEIRDLLEADYDDLWEEPQFIAAYLKLHGAYIKFLNIACSDSHGRMHPVSVYNQYRDVALAR